MSHQFFLLELVFSNLTYSLINHLILPLPLYSLHYCRLIYFYSIHFLTIPFIRPFFPFFWPWGASYSPPKNESAPQSSALFLLFLTFNSKTGKQQASQLVVYELVPINSFHKVYPPLAYAIIDDINWSTRKRR